MTELHDIDADVIITKSLVGYVIWARGGTEVIANTTAQGVDLIAAGAAAQKLSVYDAEAGHYLAGDLGQLTLDL